MNRPLLAAMSLTLAALLLPGCASHGASPFPDEAEAWGFDLNPLTLTQSR